MPIYEYECSKCGCIEEVIQKFSDKPVEKCKHCSGTLHKLISHSSFHLKGSGWYVTDYGDKSNTSKPSPTQEAKTETTSAVKSDSDKTSKPAK